MDKAYEQKILSNVHLARGTACVYLSMEGEYDVVVIEEEVWEQIVRDEYAKLEVPNG